MKPGVVFVSTMDAKWHFTYWVKGTQFGNAKGYNSASEAKQAMRKLVSLCKSW